MNLTDPSKKLTIKSWAEDDRPREKMLLKGRSALTNAELIAILIGAGNTEESAVDLSKKILASVHNDLDKLGRITIKELTKFKGIGPAKAVTITSALELGRRRKHSEETKDLQVTSSSDAYKIVWPFLSDLEYEEFYIVLLNRGNRVIETVKVSQGGVSGTVADTRIIFKAALDRLASSIILAHNHPSGNNKPSESDVKLTKNLVAAGKLLDVLVIDHIIVAGREYFSFADEGII